MSFKTSLVSVIRSTRRNFPFFVEQMKALIANASLSVKCVCAIVLSSYLLSYYDSTIEALSVIPGHLLPPSFRIWTLFTHPFLELHLWEVAIDIIVIGLCGKLIEPLWGTPEMLRFFGIVNLAVVVFCTSYYLLLYAITFDPAILFDVKIHGLSGYIAAVTVTVRQVMPDNVLFRTPLGKITNRNIPLTILVFSIILWAIGILEGTFCTMFLAGILSSWTYLRFYQKHTNGTYGDTTDFFTFASFFPNVLQPPILGVSNGIYNLLKNVGFFRNRVKTLADASSGPTAIHINLTNQEKSDADRRRQKALKLLNERLGIPKNESTVPLLDSQESYDEGPISISISSPISPSSTGLHRSSSAGSNLPSIASSSTSHNIHSSSTLLPL